MKKIPINEHSHQEVFGNILQTFQKTVDCNVAFSSIISA